MRSRRLQVILALIVVVISILLWRVEQRDRSQDVDATAIGKIGVKLAEASQTTAESTAKIAKISVQTSTAVDRLQEQALLSSKRQDRSEADASALKHRVKILEDVVNKPGYVAMMAADLQLGASAKVAITEMYQSNGITAGSNADVGMPVAADWHGQSLRETHIRPGGVVELIFDKRSGVAGGVIRFVPDLELAARGGPMDWRCETFDYPEIEAITPSCHFLIKP